MKKIFLIAAFLLLVVNCAWSQESYERIWATYYGGEATFASDDAMDGQGNLYIAGYVIGNGSYNNQFTTDNSLQPFYGGGISDGFLAKFSPNGLLLWATFFGGSGDDNISNIDIDKDDNIYVVGKTSSLGLATTGSFQENFAGITDGFLARFTVGGALVWSTYIGAADEDETLGVHCTAIGDIFLYGKTKNTTGIATTGSFQENVTLAQNSTINFISKYSINGIRDWSTYYGTGAVNSFSDITGVTSNDTGIFIAGTVTDYTANTYFSTPGAFQPMNGGNNQTGPDLFLSKFSDQGDRIWGTYFGGLNVDRSYSSNASSKRSVAATRDFVFIAGISNSVNTLSTPGVFQTIKTNYSNIIVQFDNSGNRIWCSYLGNWGPGVVPLECAALSVNDNDRLYVAGSAAINDITTPGSYQPLPSAIPGSAEVPKNDCYTSIFTLDGTTRQYSTFYGGTALESACRTLFHENGFYIVGSTSSAENIATTGSYQENLALSGDSQLSFPANAFLAKFSQIPLATEDFTKENLSIFPVPNNGNFTINLNDNYLSSTINIIDITGKIIHTEKLNTARQQLNVPNLAKGTYVVRISNGKGLGYEKKILVTQ